MRSYPLDVVSKTLYAFAVLSILAFPISGCIVQSSGQESSGISGTVEALGTNVAYQATQIASQATLIVHLATRSPAGVPTIPQPPPTPYFPVVGSVVIEEDRCCAGGIAGDSIELNARFEANSPFGEITHMRVRTSGGPLRVEQLQASSAWEPFVESRTFTVPVAINWSGFYVNVQFRDAAGNLSPVVWDDISIEGQPAPTP